MKFSLQVLCLALATTSFGADDTQLLYDHVKQIRNGTRTALDARVYYCRGMIELSPTKADDNSVANGLTNYILNIPQPLTILGSTATDGTNKTRIIQGTGTSALNAANQSNTSFFSAFATPPAGYTISYLDLDDLCSDAYEGGWRRDKYGAATSYSNKLGHNALSRMEMFSLQMHPYTLTRDYYNSSPEYGTQTEYPTLGEPMDMVWGFDNSTRFWPRAVSTTSQTSATFTHALPTYTSITSILARDTQAIVFPTNDYWAYGVEASGLTVRYFCCGYL